MQPWVEELRRHRIEAMAIDLPHGRAERAVDTYRKAVAGYPNSVIGGHSFGGRVASMLASEQEVPGLVLLSYPLHRPGHPEELRIDHWPAVKCPVLLLSGESDQFATIGLLRYPGVGHGLIPVIEDASARMATFIESIPPVRI